MEVERMKKMLRESIAAERERVKKIEAQRKEETDEYNEWRNQQELLNNDGYIGPNDINYEEVEYDDVDVSKTPFFEKLLNQAEIVESDDEEPDDDEPDDVVLDDEESDDEESDDDESDDDELVDECFTLEDITILVELGQLSPAQITAADKDDQIKNAELMIKKIGGVKGQHAKNGNTKGVENADYLLNLLRVYLDTIKTGRKYGRPRRIPYKIGTGGRYGNLVIHMPRLLTYGDLRAYKGDKLVLSKAADLDTIDLLTKKYNPRRNYSNTAKKLFQKLTKLSRLPDNVLSRKFQLV